MQQKINNLSSTKSDETFSQTVAKCCISHSLPLDGGRVQKLKVINVLNGSEREAVRESSHSALFLETTNVLNYIASILYN